MIFALTSPDSRSSVFGTRAGRSLAGGVSLILSIATLAGAQDPTRPPPADAAPGVQNNASAELQFGFREQPWLDVLDWFARQADLSLVVNEVPPGTFTYSDTKSYTPTEALDLLNGVLSTRGFALIRRERMLVCAKLTDGLPEGLIPRVELNELEQFGQFELVEVMFPLGRRPVERVANEIAPLLGAHGKATPLPETKQLLVVTTAGTMRAVSAIITSIPEPDPPKPEAPKAKPPAPTLVVYPAKDVDAQAAVQMLQTMLDDIKMTIDSRTGQINAYATPPQHEIIAKFLDQMAITTDEQLRPRLQVYELDHESPDILLQQLRLVVPSATLTLDPTTNRLIAFASPPDHQLLRDTMQTLEADTPDQLPPVPVVYVLRQIQADAALSIMQTMFPRAKFSIDAGSKRLIVLASLPQQTAIGQFLEQLESRPAAPPQIKDYPLDEATAQRARQVVQSLVPDAQLTWEPDAKRLLVIASEAQQTHIEQILRQLAEVNLAPLPRAARVYSVTARQREQFSRNFAQLDPELKDIKLLESVDPARLLVLATAAEHERIAAVLEQVKTQLAPLEKRLAYYNVTADLRQKFLSLRDQLAPDLGTIQVLEDPTDPRLGVVASEDQHRQVELLLDELRRNLPVESGRLKVFAVTPTQRSRFVALQSTIDPRLKSVRIIDESRPQELVVWATPEQLTVIESVLSTLKDTGPEEAMQLVAYPIEASDPASVQKVLSDLYPDTKIMADEESRRVTVWTTPEQHEVIAQAIQQLDAPSTARKRRMVYYRFEDVNAEEVEQLLHNLVPEMSMISDRDTNSIIAWGTDRDHDLLSKTVEDFRQQAASGKHTVVRYPCGTVEPERAQRLLRELVPSARSVADPTNRALVVWASAQDHATIAEALKQITDSNDTSDASVKSYWLARVSADQILPLLREIAPLAQFNSIDEGRQLLVWAPASNQRLIEQAIEQIEAGEGANGATSAVAYRSRSDVIRQLDALLPQIAPGAKPLADDQADLSLIWGTAAQHETIAQTVKSLEQTLDGPTEQTIRVYALGKTAPGVVIPLLDASLVDGVSVIPDTTRNALIVRGPAERHTALAQAIDTLLANLPAVRERVSQVYRLEHANPQSLQTALAGLVPDATLSIDNDTRSLIAAAYPEDHQLIEATVEQLDGSETSQQQTRTYRLTFRNSFGVRDAVQRLVPGAVVVSDRASRMLLVTASEADQQRIASVIEQMAQAEADERVAKVYRLKFADVEAAEDALQALLPDAQVSSDEKNRAIVVTADEAEQVRAAAVIEQLDSDAPTDRETRAYALPTADVRAARDAIQALLPDATLAADRDNRTLLVTARAADQQRVADIVAQIGQGQNSGRVTHVYHLQHGDVDAAREALQELLPEAVIAADRANRALLVTASEDGQARVSQVVTQLDQPGADEPQLQAYSIALANVQAVADALAGMYEDNPQVSISIDATNRSLLVKAPGVEQRTIAQIVSRMENGTALGQQRTLVAYPTDASDPEAMISTFQTLLKNADPPVDLSLNDQTRQLVAVATAAQHAIIAEAARQLQREPHLVEVFPLQTNDPFAIETAIDRLYESETAKPIANGDSQTQQLFVRGTRKQLDEVRQLLVKMGELAAEEGTAQRGVRVIPFRGNAEDALRQLQELWPQLRVNPIQVIRPAASEPLWQPAAPGTREIEPVESIESPSDASEEKTRDSRPAASDSGGAKEGRQVVRGQDPPTEPADEQPARPPIVLIPGSGRITVLSEDEAALNQAEALLRSLARQYPTDGGAGNFAVYSLRNAGARNVTRLMNDLFEQMPFTTRATMGRVSMVADERLNAVIVHGRPADRAVVGELLRVLDSSNVPDSLANPQPQIFAVGYMEAEQMLQILEGVYQTQLKTGGMGPEIEIPEGVPPQVASLLRQVNVVARGPLLTLQVDEVTNSIVVLAPRELAQEVGKLIAQLDDNARRNDARDISIVTLRETNVGQLQEALDELLRSR